MWSIALSRRQFVGESRREPLMKPWIVIALLATVMSPQAQSSAIATSEHKVRVVSKVPSIAGQTVEIYVRERFRQGAPAVPPADRVVLFVHGAGTPAEVAFD